jgi:hypothetical protein
MALTVAIILLLLAAAISAFFLSTILVLLSFAAAYLFVMEPIVVAAHACMLPFASAVPLDFNSLSPVLTNTPVADDSLQMKY